jgi:hypothetical protein
LASKTSNHPARTETPRSEIGYRIRAGRIEPNQTVDSEVDSVAWICLEERSHISLPTCREAPDSGSRRLN